MSQLRASIENPTEFVLEARTEPFSFLATRRPPASDGHAEVSPNGDVTNYYPWGMERADRFRGADEGYLVSYVFPVDDTEFLLAVCFDHALDPMYNLMAGRGHGPIAGSPRLGEQVCELIAQHLPDTWRMFVNGNGMAASPGLMRLRTPSTTQFAVAGFFTDDSPSPTLIIPPDVINEVQTSSMLVLRDVLAWPGNVPGLLGLLGEHDRSEDWAEAREGIADVLGFLPDVIKAVTGRG